MRHSISSFLKLFFPRGVVAGGVFYLRMVGIFLLVVLLSFAAQAATITSAVSGNWSNAGTWVSGTIPASIDSVVVSSGHTVLFDRNDASTTCSTIEIKNGGALKLDSTASIPRTMQVKGDIKVYGKLELVPGSTFKIECETNGQYGIIVYSDGELKGTGSVPTVLTTLAGPLAIGGQTITVADGSGFGVGDIVTLGDGANAEGFTISSISGTAITLNRKALNAQVAGAEVYKNATVTTSNISAGSKTFTVANLGGIKAGDSISIATSNMVAWDPRNTEIMTVESVDPFSNSITVSTSFSYTHFPGVIVTKNNRDSLIISTIQDGIHNAYIRVNDTGTLKFNFMEIANLGKNAFYKEGIMFDSNISSEIYGCSIHDCYEGVRLESSRGLQLIANNFYSNDYASVYILWGNQNFLISNIGYNNVYNFYIASPNNSIISNICYSNAHAIDLSYSDSFKNFVKSNTCFSNSIGISIMSSDSNLLSLNKFYFNDIGIDFSSATTYNTILSCLSYANNKGLYIDGYSRDTFIDCELGVNGDNTDGDIIFSQNNYSGIFLKNCTLASALKVKTKGISPFLVSQKNNKIDGLTKVYGDYCISAKTDQFNYSDPLYRSSSIPPMLLRGSNHTITNPATNNTTTTTEVWFVTYRSGISNWEVKGTVSGLQSNRANSGVLYASDSGQVKFTLTQAAGVQDGDQFILATIASAGDANTQKKIYFEQCSTSVPTLESSLVVNNGGKIELKGTADKPTLIDYDGAGGYGFVISGEVDAQYFDFNQINSEGIKIDPTATITKFDDGSIRNVTGFGSHLSVNGKDHTFNYLNFDNSGAYDVKVSNDADLAFVKSRRGKFSDSITDTSSISWNEPILGYTSDYLVGMISYDSSMKKITIPFKIKDPNNLICTFKSGSFQYSQNGGTTWCSVSDVDLSGIGGSFASSTSFSSAPEHTLYWNTGTNYSNLEANLAVRFRVNNGYVYGDYGTSEAIPFNLKPPVVCVLSLNGGELFKGGATAAITWSATDEGSGIANNSVAVYYTTGEGFILIADNLPNSGSYSWSVPKIDSKNVKIKVTARDNVNQTGEGLSHAVFGIDSTPPLAPAIDPVKSPTLLLSQTITGGKPADAGAVLINGSSSGVVYPTSISWSYNAVLAKGVNTFKAVACDAVSNDSSIVTAVIEVKDAVFVDPNGSGSVTVAVGAVSEEVNQMNFARLDLPGANPRGTLSLEQAFQITSNVSSFLNPISITLPKPSGASQPRPFIWDSTGNKWLAIPAKSSAGSSLTFDSNQLGIFVVFDLVDFEGPVIGDVKVNGRNMSSGDSIISKPSITLSVTDNYGLDASQMFISMDGSVSKSLAQETGKAMQAGAPITASYSFSNSEELSLGDHIFKIMAADEVGNVATREITLCVVGASIPNLLLYPNPCRAGGAVTFEASEDITVRIYDISGALVWSGQSVPGTWKVIWATVNSSGSSVAPGIYLYVITTNSGGKQSGKIAIIR